MAAQVPNIKQGVVNQDRTMTREWFTPMARLFKLLLYVSIGPGDPTGVVTMPQGAIHLRTDGGAGTTLYVLEGQTNADWDAKS